MHAVTGVHNKSAPVLRVNMLVAKTGPKRHKHHHHHHHGSTEDIFNGEQSKIIKAANALILRQSDLNPLTPIERTPTPQARLPKTVNAFLPNSYDPYYLHPLPTRHWAHFLPSSRRSHQRRPPSPSDSILQTRCPVPRLEVRGPATGGKC